MRVFFYLLFILLGSCAQEQDPIFSKGNIEQSKISIITINIQPFADVTEKQTDYIHKELLKLYRHVQVNHSIAMPQAAYYTPRNRYRADSLITFLNKRTSPGHVTIGLTNKDISWTKGTIKDYGIMGLGLCPGQACVASTFRLSKTQTLEQLFKVAIHELGHTQGLPHCPVKTCFMRDAEGKNPTNEEKEFCAKCKVYLISRGWVFK